MSQFIKELLGDRRGMTAIEYGLLVALVGIFVLTSLGIIGNTINAQFMTISSHLG